MCKKIIDSIVMFIAHVVLWFRETNLSNIISEEVINIKGKEIHVIRSKGDKLPLYVKGLVFRNPRSFRKIMLYLCSKVSISLAAAGTLVKGVPHIVMGYNECLPEYVREFFFWHEVGHIMDDELDWENMKGGVFAHLNGEVADMEVWADEYAVWILGPHKVVNALYFMYLVGKENDTVYDLFDRLCLMVQASGIEPEEDICMDQVQNAALKIKLAASEAMKF